MFVVGNIKKHYVPCFQITCSRTFPPMTFVRRWRRWRTLSSPTPPTIGVPARELRDNLLRRFEGLVWYCSFFVVLVGMWAPQFLLAARCAIGHGCALMRVSHLDILFECEELFLQWLRPVLFEFVAPCLSLCSPDWKISCLCWQGGFFCLHIDLTEWVFFLPPLHFWFVWCPPAFLLEPLFTPC